MNIDHYDRGIYYLAIGWVLTVIVLIVVPTRLYSRTILTRSVGSDDFAIVIAACLSFSGQIQDTIAVANGYGKHEALLNSTQIAHVEKWSYIDWILVFVSYFFIRASVMLFVLRLLPPYKKWQHRVILLSFLLNFAITMIATVSYGLRCRPIQAVWRYIPGANCQSLEIITVTQQVNGILACVIDIVTSILPQFLLWDLKVKHNTKIVLHIILGLGVITAALSIGRVAMMNEGIWETDNSWRAMGTATFSMVEEKCGIIFASAPALRQFFAYRRRVGTFKVTDKRQGPEQDFISFRRRVNLRDVFWYRQPSLHDGHASRPQQFWHPPETAHVPESTATEAIDRSVLDSWGVKSKKVFGSLSGNTSNRKSSAPAQKSPPGRARRIINKFRSSIADWQRIRSFDAAYKARMEDSAERGQGWPGMDPEVARRNIAQKYQGWGSSQIPEDQRAGNYEEIEEPPKTISRPQQDIELAEALSHPNVERLQPGRRKPRNPR